MSRRVVVVLLAVLICIAGFLVRHTTEVASAAPGGPDRFVYPLIVAPAADELIPCLAENPSCGRDDWYAEFDESQSTRLVQYAFVGPGLVSERRFAEAIRLLWQSPDGREVLTGAARQGVLIRSGHAKKHGPYAAWDPEDHAVWINDRYVDVSTWMLASVIGHELRHSIDPRTAADYPETSAECFDEELVAHQFEQNYVRWVATRFGGLPTSEQMKAISKDDLNLYKNLSEIATTDDLAGFVRPMYEKQCAAP
jgi:hypothetical protein